VLDVNPFLGYADYMGFMEEGDLTLDSYHFGGCNTVADSLFVRRPMVVWQGDKWYNRIGGAMLRRVGLDELVCDSEEEYLKTALRLVHADPWREELAARLAAADLDGTVFSDADAPSFRRAIEFLIANHDRLKGEPGRKPIRIL
jgi:predicted O-linked N-acetylglucosamine transferase (SPINDLY family)